MTHAPVAAARCSQVPAIRGMRQAAGLGVGAHGRIQQGRARDCTLWEHHSERNTRWPMLRRPVAHQLVRGRNNG